MSEPLRPRTAYDPDLAEAVLDALRDGLMIVQACRETGMPGAWDVMRWTRELPEFGAALGMALRDGALIRAERATLRAEGEDTPEEHKPKTARDAIARDRLAFIANRFLIGLYDPASLKRPTRFPTTFKRPGALVADTYTSASAPRPAVAEPRQAPSGFPGGLAQTLADVDRLEALVDAAVQDREVDDLGDDEVDDLLALLDECPELADRFAAQLEADPYVRRLRAEDGARTALRAGSAAACEVADEAPPLAEAMAEEAVPAEPAPLPELNPWLYDEGDDAELRLAKLDAAFQASGRPRPEGAPPLDLKAIFTRGNPVPLYVEPDTGRPPGFGHGPPPITDPADPRHRILGPTVEAEYDIHADLKAWNADPPDD